MRPVDGRENNERNITFNKHTTINSICGSQINFE
jgi:hypothetical protein